MKKLKHLLLKKTHLPKSLLIGLRISAISLMSIAIFTIVMGNKIVPNEADAQCIGVGSSTIPIYQCPIRPIPSPECTTPNTCTGQYRLNNFPCEQRSSSHGKCQTDYTFACPAVGLLRVL